MERKEQNVVIMVLLVVILIAGLMLLLKSTGVIKPKESSTNTKINTSTVINESNKKDETLEKDNNKTISKVESNKNEKSKINLGSIFKDLIVLLILLIILVGVYKAYSKLGVSTLLLKLGLFIIPIISILVLIIGAIKFPITVIFIIKLLIMIEGITIVLVMMDYYNCLEINGKIALLGLIPLIEIFITIPFLGIINLIIGIILFIYSIIAIDRLAKFFNKGNGFAIGIFLLPFIFIPILGYTEE